MLRSPLLALILCLCVATNAPAQIGISLKNQPSTSTRIQSKRIDSFTSVVQERAILAALAEPCRFKWTEGTSLLDIQRDLTRRISTVINRQALEAQGMTENTVFDDDGTPSKESTTVNDSAKPWRRQSTRTGNAETDTMTLSTQPGRLISTGILSGTQIMNATDVIKQTYSLRLDRARLLSEFAGWLCGASC